MPQPVMRRRLLAVVLVVGLAVAGWALVLDLRPSDGFTAEPDPVPPDASPSVDVRPAGHRPDRPDPDAGVPLRLVVPRLGLDAPVVRVGVTDRTLVPPDDPQVLGWWRDGAEPGAARGGALITGHTVHGGGGAMDDLETLGAGDAMSVRTGKGDVDYRVAGVRTYRKATLARDAARIFSQQRPGRLVLVTCEDWDGTQYLSNVVVIGQPA